MNSGRRKHSLRLYQQGINEPQDIKSNREQSILMSSKLMLALNQLVWEDLPHVPVSDSFSVNHSHCCRRVTAFPISAPHHLQNEVQGVGLFRATHKKPKATFLVIRHLLTLLASHRLCHVVVWVNHSIISSTGFFCTDWSYIPKYPLHHALPIQIPLIFQDTAQI